MQADDPLAAALAEARELALGNVSEVLPEIGPHAEHELGTLHGELLKALDALDAVLRFHQRIPLYGNAATEEKPGACPHHPDSDLHFEDGDGSGEWLCEGKPVGAVCSTCIDGEGGERAEWPCGEYEAILAALTGKEAPDA